MIDDEYELGAEYLLSVKADEDMYKAWKGTKFKYELVQVAMGDVAT